MMIFTFNDLGVETANLEMCTLDGCAPCFTATSDKDGWHA